MALVDVGHGADELAGDGDLVAVAVMNGSADGVAEGLRVAHCAARGPPPAAVLGAPLTAPLAPASDDSP